MVFVFRYSQVDSSAILAVAASLVRKTRYCKEARRELAPDYTDCITAIHYIFKQAMIDIPLTYIGDMPRELSLYGEWRQLVIPREDVQCGDLLFAKKIGRRQLVSHASLVLSVDSIFHCNREVGTAVIQGYEEFFSQYEQKLDVQWVIRYIDPRNKTKREEEGGIFIKNDS